MSHGLTLLGKRKRPKRYFFKIRRSRISGKRDFSPEYLWKNVGELQNVKRFLEGSDPHFGKNASLPPRATAQNLRRITTLGLMIKQSDDEAIKRDIEEYLRPGVRPSTWNTRIAWNSPYDEDPADRNLVLAKSDYCLGRIPGTHLLKSS